MPANGDVASAGASTIGGRRGRRRSDAASWHHDDRSACTSPTAASWLRPSARAASYVEEACCVSSSTTSASGVCPAAANAARIAEAHSGMTNPGHAIERDDEGLPDVALAREHFLPGSGEAVVTAAPLSGALDPAAFNEALVFEPVERGIERRDVEADGAVGALGDQAANFIAVALPL